MQVRQIELRHPRPCAVPDPDLLLARELNGPGQRLANARDRLTERANILGDRPLADACQRPLMPSSTSTSTSRSSRSSSRLAPARRAVRFLYMATIVIEHRLTHP